MNKFEAKISKIEHIDKLHIVEFDFYDTKLKMMSLDLKDDIKTTSKVILNIKPTQIILSKSLIEDIAISNQLPSKIKSIEVGKLLTCVTCNYNDTIFESIILSTCAKKLDLKKDDEIVVLIKSSDLSILELINE